MDMGNLVSKQMGNSKTKPVSQKAKKKQEPTSFFERQKQLEHEREQELQNKKEVTRNSGGRRQILTDNKNEGQGTQTHLGPARAAMPDSAPVMISYDQEAIDRMKKQLRVDTNAFLLNNIMLSVQFVENYEKIIFDLKNNSVTESDVMLNDKMAQHHKHVFMPDKLQEAIHSYVRVQTPASAANISSRTSVESLQPQRMFVVHDNVEVNEPGEISDYSTVLNAPYYRMLMEEDDEAGYVKLKKLEILESQAKREEAMNNIMKNEPISSGNESDTEEDEDTKENECTTEGRNFMNKLEQQINNPVRPIYKRPENINLNSEKLSKGKNDSVIPSKTDTNDIITERRPSGILKQTNRAVLQGKLTKQKRLRHRQTDKKVSPNGSESSGYKTSYSPQTESSGNDSDYGYAKITAETTPKKLKISQTAKFSDSTSVIPASCITVIEVKKNQKDNSDDEDDIEEAYKARYGSEFQRELYKKKFYLNSVMFMGNFTDIFLMKLSVPLGFTGDSLNEALTQGASIYCKVNKGMNKSTSFEVLPALSTTWPNAAESWMFRHRNEIRNPRTNYVYRWPTQHMIEKARGLGCLIIPLGFRATKGVNKNQIFQWKLTFPAVERYLETCLAHSHVRCYIFATLLFKIFIKNGNSKVGLDYSHLRNHLFWQCEDNFARWPEDRLGETLRIFLNTFYNDLMKSKMPDYFIPQCNLLKGIPSTTLLKQQRMLADILGSPVMHLLSSLRNLKYVKTNFYPVLNYKKLYKILTCDDIYHMINPNLPKFENTEDEDSDCENREDRGFWNEIKQKTDKGPGYKWRKEQFRQQEAKKAAESLVNNSNKLKEPFDRKLIIPSYLDSNRRRLILQLFIPHFIAMAECSERFEATRQGIIYLEHANRLAAVLKDEPGGEGDGREFIAVIREKIDILKSKAASTGAPMVPKRNESFNSTLIKPGPSGIKKNKPEQYVNLQNVNSIEIQAKSGEPVSPVVKLEKNLVLADVHVESERPRSIKAVSFQTLNEESEDDDDDDLSESRL